MVITGRLGLTLTQTLQGFSNQYEDFNLNLVNIWLHELPKGDIGKMAKEIYSFLTEFNITDLDPKLRYDVLETILPQVTFVTQQMYEHYLQDSVLSHDKKRKVALLVEALHLELCSGYKASLEAFSDHFRKNKAFIIKCLHTLSLLYLEILQQSYQMYRNPPPNLWREYHIIFQYAEQNKLQHKELEHFDVRQIRHATVNDAYHHALLLACANPYRLRSRELYKLNFTLEVWAPLLSLSKASKNHNNMFVVDISQDMPPTYANLSPHLSKNLLCLNFDKILPRIQHLLDLQASTDNANLKDSLLPSEMQLQSNVVRFLHSSWTNFSQRGADRIEQAGNIRVTIGLKKAFSAVLFNSDGPMDMTNTIEDSEYAEEIVLDDMTITQRSDESDSSFELTNTHLINISSTGLCIEFGDPLPLDLKTGDIIALEQNPEHEGLFSIGMICWIKQMNDKKARCGIKLLGPYAKPLLTIIPEQSHQINVKTLLLPQEPSFNPFYTLVTPARPFKKDTTVHVTYQGETYNVRLEEVIESTSSFTLFKIYSPNGLDLPFLQFSNKPPQVDELWDSMNL